MPIAAIIAASLASAPDAIGVPVPRVSAGQVVAYQAPASTRFAERLDIWVWFPPSYGRDPDRRYPVLYMHDGQNLFDPALTHYGKAWQMDEAMARLAGQGALREWIIVGVRSPSQRYTTLFPEKLFDLLPSARQARFTDEAGQPLIRDDFKGDDYLDWLVHELKPSIDTAYATLPGPDDTAIMGASMGALASLYAMGEYPDVFGQAAGLSNPLLLGWSEDHGTAEDVAEITAAWAAWLDRTGLKPGGANRLYIDTGTVDLDAYFPPYLDSFDTMMAARGWSGADYQSRRFEGAEHDELAWHERVDIPLTFLDRHNR